MLHTDRNGSLGFAVRHHQIWRQLHCRQPAVQLLAKHSRQNRRNHWKRWMLLIFLFMSMPLLTGCFLDVKRLVEIAGDNRELLPIRSFKIIIDPRQREQLFKQFHNFAEKHGFEIVISDYGTNFESYLIWMVKDNIKINATHTSHDRDIVSVWFYDQSRAKPTPEETMDTINELAVDLESFIMEIPDVTIKDKR